MTFDVFPHIITGMKQETFELGGAIPTWPVDINPDPYYVENLGFVPESDQMPLIDAFVTAYKPYCDDHILGPLDKETFCAPMPGFTGTSGNRPQEYLIWSVDPSANNCKGYPDKECFSLDWWQHFTKSNPDPSYPDGLRFFVVSQTFSADGNPAGSIGEQADLLQQAWRILPDQPADNSALCRSRNRYFRVALDAMTSLGEFTSYSSQVEASCVKALGVGDTVQLQVLFHSMDLENIDGGIAENVYGQFTARVNGQLRPTLVLGWWNFRDPAYWNPAYGTFGYIPSLGNGLYDLSGFNFCGQPPQLDCSWVTDYSAYFFNHDNKLLITVGNGDALQLFVELYSLGDSIDVLCNQFVWVGPRRITQWADMVNEESYNLISAYNANCNVLAILKVVNVSPHYP